MSAVPWPEPPLRGERVLLRPWQPDDLPVLVALGQDRSIARWFPVIPSPYTESDAAAWLEGEEAGRLQGRGIAFAIASADEGEVIGGISLGSISGLLRTASIGYWLAPEARGHGYMASSLELVTGWAFQSLGLARLEASIDPENRASQQVAEGRGFLLEGRLRSSTIIRETGERRDALVYGLLAD